MENNSVFSFKYLECEVQRQKKGIKTNPPKCLLSKRKRRKKNQFCHHNCCATCLNDCCSIVLTPAIVKCLKQQVMTHIKSCIPPTLDWTPYSVRLWKNTFYSGYDTTLFITHLALSHLYNQNTYCMLENCSLISVQHSKLPLTFTDETKAFGLCTPLQLDPRLPD